MGIEPARARVAVVGAGLAGLACALALKGHVAGLAVLEREPSPGGRLGGPEGADLGAQYLTARHPLFQRCVQGWEGAGLVRRWPGWVVDLSAGRVAARDETAERFVGVPSMAALAGAMARALPLGAGVAVEELERADGRWRLFDGRGAFLGEFDAVLLATPAPEAAELLAPRPDMAREAARVRSAACWSVALDLSRAPGLPYDGAFVQDSPLRWIADDGAKPGRDGAPRWVAQASPEWSERHLLDGEAAVGRALAQAFVQAVGLPGLEIERARARCWRAARPLDSLARDCLYDPAAGIGACGDWCAGPRIEGAVLSGMALAERFLRGIPG